jgi:Uma2 family endonuclease
VADPGKRREATYQDVLDAPEHMVAELIDGELVLSPRPGFAHQLSQTNLLGRLLPPFHFGDDGPGGWIFLIEPELHLGNQILVPDLAAWRHARFPEPMVKEAFATVAPDWLCEGLSPSTRKLDRLRKLPIYATAGIGHAWLVDAAHRTLEVYGLVAARYELIQMFCEGDAIRAEPFAELELTIEKIMDLPNRASERAATYGG